MQVLRVACADGSIGLQDARRISVLDVCECDTDITRGGRSIDTDIAGLDSCRQSNAVWIISRDLEVGQATEGRKLTDLGTRPRNLADDLTVGILEEHTCNALL